MTPSAIKLIAIASHIVQIERRRSITPGDIPIIPRDSQRYTRINTIPFEGPDETYCHRVSDC